MTEPTQAMYDDLCNERDVALDRAERAERHLAADRAILDRHLLKTADGVYYSPYDPKCVNPDLWVVWRYDDDAPWKVSRAFAAQDSDDLASSDDLFVADAEEICEVRDVYSTREAAEAAKGTP